MLPGRVNEDAAIVSSTGGAVFVCLPLDVSTPMPVLHHVNGGSAPDDRRASREAVLGGVAAPRARRPRGLARGRADRRQARVFDGPRRPRGSERVGHRRSQPGNRGCEQGHRQTPGGHSVSTPAPDLHRLYDGGVPDHRRASREAAPDDVAAVLLVGLAALPGGEPAVARPGSSVVL
jgi:hypothetical protein